jgi:hypothetical protein
MTTSMILATEVSSQSTWSDPVAVATVLLVLVTLGLVIATFRQVRFGRRSLNLSIRPLLADPLPVPVDAKYTEVLQFGPPGRDSFAVRPGELHVQNDRSSTQISLALRNIGGGVAVIREVTTDPSVAGSVYYSPKFVPVGETIRINISVLHGVDESQIFEAEQWAYDGFTVAVTYTDGEGDQELTSKAIFKQYATQGPFVESIEVYKHGKSTPFLTGSSSH